MKKVLYFFIPDHIWYIANSPTTVLRSSSGEEPRQSGTIRPKKATRTPVVAHIIRSPVREPFAPPTINVACPFAGSSAVVVRGAQVVHGCYRRGVVLHHCQDRAVFLVQEVQLHVSVLFLGCLIQRDVFWLVYRV